MTDVCDDSAKTATEAIHVVDRFLQEMTSHILVLATMDISHIIHLNFNDTLPSNQTKPQNKSIIDNEK